MSPDRGSRKSSKPRATAEGLLWNVQRLPAKLKGFLNLKAIGKGSSSSRKANEGAGKTYLKKGGKYLAARPRKTPRYIDF